MFRNIVGIFSQYRGLSRSAYVIFFARVVTKKVNSVIIAKRFFAMDLESVTKKIELDVAFVSQLYVNFVSLMLYVYVFLVCPSPFHYDTMLIW